MTAGGDASIEAIEAELEAITGPRIAAHQSTFRAILEDALAKDAYVCTPSPRRVFFGDALDGARIVTGAMPHYGVWLGPMRYVVRRIAGRWRVEVRISVVPPPASATLELPDCELAAELDGPVHCRGTPYARAPSTRACPASGDFAAPATKKNVRALLARWSARAEAYYNRDAEAFHLPITYDFEYTLAGEASASLAEPDLELPLWPTCGRTPYFAALRSGWSVPVVAHEMGHVLGLLDEYETFSGIVSFYPKKPFPGAEVSRMGLSMRESTVVLPLHHYLVLRRAFCPEPSSRDPYEHALR